MNFLYCNNSAFPVLFSRNVPEGSHTDAVWIGDVATQDSVRSLFLQDRVEFEHETEFGALFLLGAAQE